MLKKIIFTISVSIFSSLAFAGEPMSSPQSRYFDNGAKTILTIAASPQYKAIFSNYSAYMRGYEENLRSITYTGVGRVSLVTNRWARGANGRDIPLSCKRTLEIVNNVVVVGAIACVQIY